MTRKVLHMIGNSHIDPVWFWRWEEGMQEVHATFRSALDRMKEYPEFRFTATSAAFFAYIEQIDPGMLEEIRQRVAEGRFELTGGWWLEPDCNQPCGESFARHALYGQRTFRRLFGRQARIGSNVDSFGHHPQIPQLLRQAGMDAYVFLRPNVTTVSRVYTPDRAPVFRWQAPDGSEVLGVSLPGEYTTWFLEPTRRNIDLTLSSMGDLPTLPCCYGVGNHGGGPTIANIEAIHQLQAEYPETELRFSTLESCLDELRGAHVPVMHGYFDHVNPGCYSVDHFLKQANRQAEAGLIRAEKLLSMARLAGAGWLNHDTAPLWQRVLFNQFHDTMGGTIIEEAHEDAVSDVRGVVHQAGVIANLAMHAVIASVKIEGEGVPVYLFNLTGEPWRGVADVEIDWFCQDNLRLVDDQGRELPYARIKQSCTMVWTVLGGRRRLLFEAEVPAFGVRVYYAQKQASTLRLETCWEGDDRCLDNGLVCLRLNEQGEPVSLMDKATGFDALTAPAAFYSLVDDRDPWGHEAVDFGKDKRGLTTDSVKCIEHSDMRQVLRVCQHADGLRIETQYMLYAGENAVRMQTRVSWDLPWRQLRLSLPAAAAEHISESPFGVMTHGAADEELFMHRFVDLRRADGAGLAVAADSISAFQPMDGTTDLLLLRSPIYAQGGPRERWMNDHDTYHYMDIGYHSYSLTLTPHGAPMAQHELFTLADRLEQGCQYLVGGLTDRRGTQALPDFRLGSSQLRLGAVKRAEEGDAMILRLHETDGQPCHTTLTLDGGSYPLSFRPYEIKTLRLAHGQLTAVNLLEDPDTNEEE